MITILAAACLALCQDDKGKELFQKLEKKMADAKTLSVTFKGTVGGANKADYTGRVRMKTGKKYTFNIKIVEEAGDTELTLISDGTRRLTIQNGRRSEDEPKDGTDDLFRRATARCGFVVLFLCMANVAQEVLPAADEILKSSEFALGGEEKLGEKTARVLTYTIAVKGMGDAKVKLWLDEKDLILLKREVKVTTPDSETVFNETYSDQSTDDIEDKIFEVGK